MALPVPKPRKGEGMQEFVSRCIPIMKKLDPERTDEQIQAICYSTYRHVRGIKRKEGDK